MTYRACYNNCNTVNITERGVAMLIAEKNVDMLGRIVIPAKMRQKLNLKPSDAVCVVFDGKQIILKKIK